MEIFCVVDSNPKLETIRTRYFTSRNNYTRSNNVMLASILSGDVARSGTRAMNVFTCFKVSRKLMGDLMAGCCGLSRGSTRSIIIYLI